MSDFLSTRPSDLADLRVALGEVFEEIRGTVERELKWLDRERGREIEEWKREKNPDPEDRPEPFGYEDACSAVEEAFVDADVHFLEGFLNALDRSGFEVLRVSCLTKPSGSGKTIRKPRVKRIRK